MKKNLAYSMFSILFFCGLFLNACSNQNVRDGVFFHISCSYDNPHKVLMALSLANKMSEDKDVIVFLDIRGVEIALKEAEDVTMENFESMKSLLRKLIDKKIEIMVCPMCLKKAGKQPEDLIEGAKLADKEKFFSFTKGRILTLDYN